jgi:hypothetical protein
MSRRPVISTVPGCKVEQQAADDGQALQNLSTLPWTEHHAYPGVAVRQPERDGGEADQHQSRPTRPQADDQSQRPKHLGGNNDRNNIQECPGCGLKADGRSTASLPALSQS